MPPVFPTPPTSTAEPPPLQTLYPPASWSRLALELNTALDQLRAAHAEIDELRQADLAAHAAHSAELAKARQVTEQLYDKFRRAQTQLEQHRAWRTTATIDKLQNYNTELRTKLMGLQASSSEALRRNREQYEEKRATHERQLREMRGLSHSQLVENEVLRRQIEELRTKLEESSATVEELRTKLEAAEIARDEAYEDRAVLIRKEAEYLQHQREAARRLTQTLSMLGAHLHDVQSVAIRLTQAPHGHRVR